VGRHEGKKSLERTKRRYEHTSNIEMNLKGSGWVSEEWIHLIRRSDKWRALVNAVMNCPFPKMPGIIY
jgi:hypothetical protein